MPPKIENNELNRIKPFELPPKKDAPVKPNEQNNVIPNTSGETRRWESNIFGAQQKDRLERLYGAGTAGIGTFNDIRLARATSNANKAYADTYAKEWNALKNPALSANPPKNMIEVSQRAENAYRTSLANQGFTPSDVRGASVIKTADFLRSQANIGGDLTTLSPAQIQQRIAGNYETNYFVRILDSNHLGKGDSRLSRQESPHTWVATPEEIAGAKLDTFETMKRVGYSDDYIGWIKGEVAAGRKNLSDFTLFITEANGTTGKTQPSWNALTDRAKNHPGFTDYQSKPNSFWNDVQNLDFQTELPKFNADRKGYLSSLTPAQQDVFNARQRMNQLLGVNEFFTNDGRTARTDGQNKTYGVREFLIDNTELGNIQRNTFVELQNTGKTNLQTVERPPVIAENPLRLGSEMRNGALIGGATSAVTSLPQVFDQIQSGDYTGAAQTFGTNTALGTSVGAFSAGGERIIGRGFENALGNSRFANSLIDRTFTNGGARNVVSRLAQTEISNLSSTTFNSTVRQVAGRVGGAGVIGGVVNGAFSAYDQIGAYNRGEVTASQAIGTVTGEAAVGVGAGMAGAAAGAAIGSIIPGAGTVVGGIIGFGVGMAAGYLADKGLRGLGVNTMIANGVTATIDAASSAASAVSNTVSEVAGNLADGAKNMLSGAASRLSSIFG